MESEAKVLSYTPSPRFWRRAMERYKQEVGNNPDLRQAVTLPARWDFHRPKVYLTREQKTALQLSLAKMTKAQMKEQIDSLWQMEHEKLRESKKYAPGKIILPEQETKYQEAYKWAFYCREAAKFAEYYLRSLEHQKKV